MKATHALPSRYALILDPVEIRKLITKVDALHLPRRECHPLDQYKGKKVNPDLAHYDAAIDRDLIDDDMPVESPAPTALRRSAKVTEDSEFDPEWDS